MATRRKTAFERDMDERMDSPEFAEEYAAAKAEITAMDLLVRRIERARVRAKLTKEELAKRSGMSAPALRKVLTSPEANPTVATLVAMLAPLGLQLAIVKAPAKAQRTTDRRARARNSAPSARTAA